MNCAPPLSVMGIEQKSRLDSVYKKEVVEVIFGTPSKNCAGMGVCMVARPNTRLLQRVVCPGVLSTLSYQHEQIVFEFQYRHINPIVIKQRFLEPCFWVEEPFMLPLYLVRKWSLPTRWIAPGAYPIFYQNDIWRITCRMDVSVHHNGPL
jgi:hypothetical protein